MPWRARVAIRRGVCLALALPAFVLQAAAAQTTTQTQTGQLTVSAFVASGCALTGGTLDFGSYVSGQQSDHDATGEIRYENCSGRLTFELGGGTQGSVNDRKMRGPDATLAYQIYRGPSRQEVWGMGGDAVAVDSALNGIPSSGLIPVHGRIPGGQSVPGGNYTDIINITLTF